jgi:hypothetical protein
MVVSIPPDERTIMSKPTDTTNLQSLPSIGPSLARELRDLGFEAPDDLRDQDPEKMFEDLCALRGQAIDRCMLYSFRCAVHVVNSGDDDPELRKWWNWMDKDR